MVLLNQPCWLVGWLVSWLVSLLVGWSGGQMDGQLIFCSQVVQTDFVEKHLVHPVVAKDQLTNRSTDGPMDLLIEMR